MDVRLLTEADFTLSRCGRPIPREGLSAVYFPRSYVVQGAFTTATGGATSPPQTLIKEITGDTNWVLRAISGSSYQANSGPGGNTLQTTIFLQVQLPNGKFLISGLQDVFAVAGYGSWRGLLAKEVEVPPGSKVKVTLALAPFSSPSFHQPQTFLLEGAYKYYLKKQQTGDCRLSLAAAYPRYLDHPNQNILAPCYIQGYGPETPEGWEDEQFIYGPSPLVSINVVSGPFVGTANIDVNGGEDFEVRRILFDTSGTSASVTGGRLLTRVRRGSGYAFTDDYVDLINFGSTLIAHDWHIDAADQVFCDFQLVDQAGTGNMQVQFYLDGVKRRRKAA
jgi:hypothetical protein